MPAPAVYVFGAVGLVATLYAFDKFVYEPHIAPKIEAWAEAFLERRRQRRQRHNPVPAQPYPTRDGNDENRARRSGGDPFGDKKGSDAEGDGVSVELEQLVTQEVNEWRGSSSTSGLRHRRTAGMMDESNTFLPYSPLSPTHVIFDSSSPSSPMSPDRPSNAGSHVLPPKPSVPISPSLSVHSFSEHHQPPRVVSPRLPTPMSNYSAPSSRALTPNMTDFGSSISSEHPRASTLAHEEYHVPPSMYNTALMDVTELARGIAMPSNPDSRAHSPFSDVYSVGTHSSMSGMALSDMRSPTIGSDIDLPSDDDYDVLSPRSGMLSPGSAPSPRSAQEELPSDAQSQQGSEESWSSVGRRTPDF